MVKPLNPRRMPVRRWEAFVSFLKGMNILLQTVQTALRLLEHLK
jgi:hypothetical protein